MKSTNYFNTLILVAEDCPTKTAIIPSKSGSIAAWQHALLSEAESLTSDDLLVAVTAHRREVPADEWPDLRDDIFAKPQACLRTSPLVKQFGWGLFHDAMGHVHLIAVDSPDYAALVGNPAITKVRGMRSKRA